MPTSLHTHTQASQLDGLATAEEIAARCQEIDMGSVCCTDHDFVAGHIDFYKTISKAGIKPLLGIETYQTPGPRQTNFGARSGQDSNGEKQRIDNFHLILIAMNNKGLQNLWAMNTEAHLTGFYYNGRVDWELLEKYNEGIVCTSACGLSMLSQAVRGNEVLEDVDTIMNRYLNIFGDRFFVELSTYTEDWQRHLNYALARTADAYSVPLVYANDAHYAFPGQYELHETVLCMQYQEKKSQRDEPHHTPDLYIHDEKQIRDAWYYLPESVIDEALKNSDIIAQTCNVTLPEYKMHVPVFIHDKKYKSSAEMAYELAVEGYKEKIIGRGIDSDVYLDRFKMEVEVMYEANLYNYFLIVADFVNWAKAQGYLVGPGRGSVGGSLVAYLLGIHEIDPIRYGLIFERFYNAGRKGSMPDIDIDFPTFARIPLRQYAVNKYGADKCSDIGTVSKLQGRAAIQKIGATLEIPYSDTTAISKIIEKAIKSGQQPKWQGDKGIWALCGEELAPYVRKHPQLFEYAETMHGRTYTYGVHPSGYLIADVPLAEHFPLRWVSKDKKGVSQWDMRIAEEMGFMKIDFLGLRNLDSLMKYNEVLREQVKPEVDFYDVKRMDEDGELPDAMWEQVDNGLTVGVFQVEDGVKAKWLGRHIKPRNLEEIALLTALNRPGPQSSGADVRYIHAREGNPEPEIHPIVSKVAHESHGEIIYQEQLINFFIELGYDPKEADAVRKITGKKLRDEMAALYDDYVERFRAKGADDEAIAKVWGVVEGFADYAFNKAHSVEYGLITLWTLYAKWLNPIEFYLGSIKSLVAEGEKGEVPRYTREAQRYPHNGVEGYGILPVHMNHSKVETSIEGDSIRYGFVDIKGVGRTAAEWLVNHRPFTSLDNIVEVASMPEYKVTLKNGIRKMAVTRGHVEAIRKLTELEGEQLFMAEEELLGYALSDNSATILEDHAAEIAEECVSLEDLEDAAPGLYNVAAIITNIKEAKTRKGQPMAWVTLEADGTSLEIPVWSDELTRLAFVWRRRQAVVAQIKVTQRGKNIQNARILYAKDN